MTGAVDVLVTVFFVAVLVVVSVVDVRRRIVPNRIVLPAAALVLAARTIVHPSVVWLVGGLGAALFLLAAAVVRPGGMGMGDVKLALLLGVAEGRTVPLALLVALFAAAIPSAALLVRHGLKARTMAIPFAPFLALGGVVALALGVPLG
ncbi:MAG TPA: prepilin peptidase [Gaiellaceae bacterium]|nr:prepilin peptidase [Gaiellaceae bacterium]